MNWPIWSELRITGLCSNYPDWLAKGEWSGKELIEVSYYEGVAPLYAIIHDLRAMRPSTIASETDAKVTRSSPSFKIHRGSVESTQEEDMGRFGVAAIFARREPYLDSFRVFVGLREDNRRMRSRVIYYEIEKREKYEDSDERADSDLAIVKT
ncbi:hypothetical protein PIB30_093077 [Stylosanthes scabra]|uniref:Uncharacterized protein n=1 Tax=Stylosanthes scabra TaxID=79078 RepID=A0ABU6UVS3_9FABA|nr:hypothetical protein [Stylosanthes scabra]